MKISQAVITLVSFAAFPVTHAARAQAPASPDASVSIAKMSARDRILAAASSIGLNGATGRPWHLTLDITVIDPKTGAKQPGTVDVWRAGDDSRTTLVFGTGKHIQLHSNGKLYYSDEGEPVPDVMDAALAVIMQPGPSDSDIDGSKPDLRRETMGKTDVDCIMLTQPIRV